MFDLSNLEALIHYQKNLEIITYEWLPLASSKEEAELFLQAIYHNGKAMSPEYCADWTIALVSAAAMRETDEHLEILSRLVKLEICDVEMQDRLAQLVRDQRERVRLQEMQFLQQEPETGD